MGLAYKKTSFRRRRVSHPRMTSRLGRRLSQIHPTPPLTTRSPCRLNVLEVVTAADAVEGGWVSTFSRVVRLKILSLGVNQLCVHLAPFHKFSRTLKSLDMAILSFLPSQVVDLICYFPLLEDFTLLGRDNDDDEPRTVGSSGTSPALTGTLELHLIWGTARIVDRLLGLPNGLRFRNLKLTSYSKEDTLSVGKLVDACSDTLEYLEVWYQPRGANLSFSFGRLVIDLNFNLQVNLQPVWSTYPRPRNSKRSCSNVDLWISNGSP
jgi:hypothetical protein